MATNALLDTKKIESTLLTLQERAEAITVTDQDSYTAACKIVTDGRQEVKAIGFVYDPIIASAKSHLDDVKDQKSRWVNRITPIVSIVEQKAEQWKAEERRKAKAEEDRINEERRIETARIAAEERKVAEAKAEAERKEREKEIERQRKAGELKKKEADALAKKAAEDAERLKKLAAEQEQVAKDSVQDVTVEANVPKVAGIRGRVNFKFEIVNASLLERRWLKPDEVAIGTEVRRLKDKAQAERTIPGIRVWEEDSI
jgi:DNA repair exonuclease SbcCD ATPase subunit